MLFVAEGPCNYMDSVSSVFQNVNADDDDTEAWQSTLQQSLGGSCLQPGRQLAGAISYTASAGSSSDMAPFQSVQPVAEQPIPLPRFLLRADRGPTADMCSEMVGSGPPLPLPPPQPSPTPQPLQTPQTPHSPRSRSENTAQVTGLVSMGSLGHPTSCAAPCKYVKKKHGCRDGVVCRYCHLCQWHHLSRWRKLKPAEMATASQPDAVESPDECGVGEAHDVETQVDMIDPFGRIGGFGQPPSVGSLDHPFGCGPPCRYAWRSTGCRNEHNCLRCHLCHWSRRL